MNYRPKCNNPKVTMLNVTVLYNRHIFTPLKSRKSVALRIQTNGNIPETPNSGFSIDRENGFSVTVRLIIPPSFGCDKIFDGNDQSKKPSCFSQT
jgi:hypothetical protein